MINWRFVFLGSTIIRWAAGLAAGLLVLLVLGMVKWLAHRRVAQPSQPPRLIAGRLILGILDHTSWLFIVWLAVFTLLRFLNLTPPAVTVIDTLAIIFLWIQVGIWSVEIIAFFLVRRQLPGQKPQDARRGTVGAILVLAKIVVWTLVLILALENIPGIHVTALIASLGIGGIAIGLALQKVLGDVFASLTISIDQPFVEGDAINVDEFSGEVEHIGLKSTRLRSYSGEQVILSNSDLLESRIRNYKLMQHRQVVFTLQVTYDTPYKKLQKIPRLIQEIIESQPKVTFNRAHFKAYDPSALVFEVVYTVNTADFTLYMDLQQEINLEIFRQFHEAGIRFAYPTQTILLEK